ncbi:MAG TPA: glycerol-3-phosphate 1-O-acyltransferase PlsY [Candidatus Acidoferrales bacterium]|nr:glycerol-3-phosphate 1-O-acyltransferase PlsY [Candidatus Acidoferrales bacterium]
MNSPLIVIGIAYLLGSIPFGYLIVRFGGGNDIRERGSGNIGAANVARNAGMVAGVLTLLFDAAKGYAAVSIASRLAPVGDAPRWMMAAAIAAVVGHMFPVWLGFQGGKGIATSLGVFLPICREAVLAAVILWILVVAFWRFSSLGSIVAAAAMPVFVYLLYAPRHAPPGYITLGTMLIAVLVLIKHRANIERLVAGNEPPLKPPRL